MDGAYKKNYEDRADGSVIVVVTTIFPFDVDREDNYRACRQDQSTKKVEHIVNLLIVSVCRYTLLLKQNYI